VQLRGRRFGLLLALTLVGPAMAAAQAPQIARPRPAPPGPSSEPPLPPATIDNSLIIGGDDIHARKVGTRMTVDTQVNGRGPYHFLVDSGADTSVVGLRIAHDLALPLGTPAILNGTTDRSIVDRVKVAQLVLGRSAITDLELPALREQDLGGEGMVGIDALVNQRLMMDFEKKVIKVEDATVPEKYYPGAIVITARRRHGQLILTQVKAAGLALDAVVDTGSEVTIGNVALRNKLIRGNHDKFWTVEATGVTGVTRNMQMALIGELKIGPITLHNVPIAFADVPPFEVFGLSKQPSLLLGTDLLATFRRVSLDFRARKVRFLLKNCASSGVAISTAPDAGLTRLFANDMEACQS
jgi:predicted aspartyl protease